MYYLLLSLCVWLRGYSGIYAVVVVGWVVRWVCCCTDLLTLLLVIFVMGIYVMGIYVMGKMANIDFRKVVVGRGVLRFREG